MPGFKFVPRLLFFVVVFVLFCCFVAHKTVKVSLSKAHSSGAVCESRGGRPELSVLTSLLVSVDIKNY